MAVYRIYPEKDTFIFSETNIAGQYGNAGKDEVVEIGGYTDIKGNGQTNRTLIQYATKDIQAALRDTVNGQYTASLHFSLATATTVPDNLTVYAAPVTAEWHQGVGKRDDSPYNTKGCTWRQRIDGTNWSTIGGDFSSTNSGSQTFNLNSELDLDIDVTNAVDAIASGSNNYGFLLKVQDSLEANTTSSVMLKYFGADTNTVFPPYLEFKWDDQVYSSSLSTLDTNIATVSIKNNEERYKESDTVRFRINARPKYPTRSFTTSSVYLTNYKLPESSTYSLVDEYSGQVIIPFDSKYTKISADDTSSYFDLIMDSLQTGRYYRLLIKSTLDGSTVVLDDKLIFRVD